MSQRFRLGHLQSFNTSKSANSHLYKRYNPNVLGQSGIIVNNKALPDHAIYVARSDDKYFVLDFNDYVDNFRDDLAVDGFDGWARDWKRRPMRTRRTSFIVDTTPNKGNCFAFAYCCWVYHMNRGLGELIQYLQDDAHNEVSLFLVTRNMIDPGYL